MKSFALPPAAPSDYPEKHPVRLLLTDTRSKALGAPTSNLDPLAVSLRATTQTAFMENILAATPYRHGGLND